MLEIAVGVAVLGVISGALLAKTIAARKAARVQVTHENIAYIKSALAAYLSNNNCLPMPAMNDSGVSCGISGANFDLKSFVGRVPYSTLGIPKKYSLDGDARPIMYIVEPACTCHASSIYEHDISGESFCRAIARPMVEVVGIKLSLPDVVAFALDTRAPVISDKIYITPSVHTSWISRDVFLIQYLKGSPCRRENNSMSASLEKDDFLF